MKPRISMITLAVNDLATAVRFYQQGLGFPRMESAPEIAFFTLNGSWLSVYPRKALAEDATVSPAGNGFEGFTISHNVSSEAEVDQVLSQAIAAGATLVKSAQKVFWGVTPVISKTQMVIFGRSRTIPISGLVPPTMLPEKWLVCP